MGDTDLKAEDIEKVAKTMAEYKLTTVRVSDIMDLANNIAKLETTREKEEIRSIAFQSGIVVGMFLTLGIVGAVLIIQGFA